MPTIKLTCGDIWLKGTGAASRVWTPTVSGLPAGAIINSVTLTFSSGNNYASPGRTEIFWGSEALAANRLWYVSQSSGSGGTIDLTGRVKGNGSFSLLFRKTANSAGSQSNVYFSGITITIDYTNPISTFSLDRTTLDAGTALGVTINRVDSSYTHKVTFAFGGRSYTATGVATSVSYTIPVAWLDQIPNATSGTGTVTVETLSSAGTSMGSVSASFTLTAGAGVVPTVGTIKAEVVSGLDGLYIQGYSKCKVSVSGHSAGTGATVASVLISGNGDSAWATSIISSLLRTAGTVTFTVKVTDSRGRATSGTVSITVQAYKAVAITGRTALRCKSDGTVSRVTGKSAKLGVSYTMTTVGSNAATVKVYWRIYGSSSWTQISGWSSASGYTAVALADAVALDKRYEIRFDVADKLSMASQTAVIEPGVVYMVWSKVKSSFGLGTYPTGEKQVAIAEDWRLMLGSMDVGKAIRQRDRVRNLLDNSDFTNPVNQRGQNAYKFDSGYTIDRWKLHWSGDGNITVQDGYITLYRKTYNAYLFQFPEKVEKMVGKTYTVAAKVRYNGFIGWIDSTQRTHCDSVHSNDWLVVTHTFTVGSSTSDLGPAGVEIGSSSNLSFELQWIALYEGAYTADTLPPYVPKGYVAELAECHRYYYKTVSSNWDGSVCNAIGSNAYAPLYITFPVPMRITPTVSNGVSSCDVFGTGTVSASITNASVDRWHYSCMATVPSTYGGRIIRPIGAMTFSADL